METIKSKGVEVTDRIESIYNHSVEYYVTKVENGKYYGIVVSMDKNEHEEVEIPSGEYRITSICLGEFATEIPIINTEPYKINQ